MFAEVSNLLIIRICQPIKDQRTLYVIYQQVQLLLIRVTWFLTGQVKGNQQRLVKMS